MTRAAADAIARAVLYEGYRLYPYRASSVKNRRRWTLGAVLPRAWCDAAATGDRWRIRTEVVVRGDADTAVGGVVRFLATDGDERAIELAPRRVDAGAIVARFVDRAVVVAVERAVTPAGAGLWRVAIEVANTTPIEPRWSRDDALAYALGSAHVVVEVTAGEVVSAVEPPADATAAVAACVQDGLWPALLGPHAMLAAPIVLPDRPELAPESPGDLFDATEIDEILILRIQTMTPAEKREACAGDARVAALIERCDALGPEAMLALHGRHRGVAAAVAPGDAVILRPRPRGDVLDTVLAGRAATVASVEHDLDGRIHVAVTIDDDPGRDLGAAGFPGHRFFFAADEVERR